MEGESHKGRSIGGVILLSSGCPSGRGDVGHFIRRILGDRDVMNFPMGGAFSLFAAPAIARFRRKKVIRRYELVGGFDRLAGATGAIASAMQRRLGIEVRPAYRYSKPGFHEVLSGLKGMGIGRVAAVPMNPQFSISTSGSFVSVLVESLKRLKMSAAVLSSFCGSGRYIDLMVDHIDDQGPPDGGPSVRGGAHVVFVAHSVPVRNLGLGDPYVTQVEGMAEALTRRLGLEGRSSLAWQSSAGPIAWVGPDAGDHVRELAGRGVESLVVVPLSFVVENLETLYDLDVELKRTAAACGIHRYFRVPVVGEGKKFAEFLSLLVEDLT
jgi:ferrochelatase